MTGNTKWIRRFYDKMIAENALVSTPPFAFSHEVKNHPQKPADLETVPLLRLEEILAIQSFEARGRVKRKALGKLYRNTVNLDAISNDGGVYPYQHGLRLHLTKEGYTSVNHMGLDNFPFPPLKDNEVDFNVYCVLTAAVTPKIRKNKPFAINGFYVTYQPKNGLLEFEIEMGDDFSVVTYNSADTATQEEYNDAVKIAEDILEVDPILRDKWDIIGSQCLAYLSVMGNSHELQDNAERGFDSFVSAVQSLRKEHQGRKI
ncbi:hypothetical protein KW805_03060 [Candidatus Pacearchaeota archaeon]|nr:hypothetical protein [Candidatus Pacearchaeota archaeon]